MELLHTGNSSFPIRRNAEAISVLAHMGRYVASVEVNCLCAGSLFAWTVLIVEYACIVWESLVDLVIAFSDKVRYTCPTKREGGQEQWPRQSIYARRSR